MTRGFASFVLFGVMALWGSGAVAEDKKAERVKERPAPAVDPTLPPEEPPEEDPGLVEKEYAFNPLQAQKEVTVGNFYFKKGNYAAAAKRFVEATRWNPTFADAFLRLGEAYEKLGREDKAREAYEQFVTVAPDHKKASDIKKWLAKKPQAK